MASPYPYTLVPGRLREFLAKIPEWGTPTAVTHQWLDSVGFKGGSGKSVLGPLKFVGILEPDGKPAAGWKALRSGTAGKREFASLVRAAYKDLFETFPDAQRKDTEALRNFFRAHTHVGEQAQAKIVQTFRAITEAADWDGPAGSPIGASAPSEPGESLAKAPALKLPALSGKGGLTLNVEIQLQLPATADSEVYEKLFAAMRKHLIALDD